ncbi:MAG: UDPglucose--hexose-1-phosphate uridylyltransferase [Flavobacterium sp.]|jgi:UDPglucose--hexose-1-phosphate uridylyltransferase
MENLKHHPHRRQNPLTGDWILISPHRTKRPWQGQTELVPDVEPSHDTNCFLCSGNTRINGTVNPTYAGPHVFDNDFPALTSTSPDRQKSDGLFISQPVTGLNRVICYSELHNQTLPEMEQSAVLSIVDTWCQQYEDLGQQYEWVQIFENKGAVNGCSNPHPHGQIWASSSLPSIVLKENQNQDTYFKEHGKNLLIDYADRERQAGDRLVCSNKDWIALVPYWATWPYEVLILPTEHISHMEQLNSTQRSALASILKDLTTRYDNLFETSFPYSMGWHCAPYNAEDKKHWQLHCHLYPPLLRSATIKKFMVGYEMLAEAQRDMTPEQAAAELRAQPIKHYKSKVS